MTSGSLLGAGIVVLDLWALQDLWRRPVPIGARLLWTLFVVLLPLFGVLAYSAMGRG